MSHDPVYEVYAVRYAHYAPRRARENFLVAAAPDTHFGSLIDLIDSFPSTRYVSRGLSQSGHTVTRPIISIFITRSMTISPPSGACSKAPAQARPAPASLMLTTPTAMALSGWPAGRSLTD